MPVPNHEHATALMTEYTYHGQENRLETYGLEPPGPYEILLKASLQVRHQPCYLLPWVSGHCLMLRSVAACHALRVFVSIHNVAHCRYDAFASKVSAPWKGLQGLSHKACDGMTAAEHKGDAAHRVMMSCRVRQRRSPTRRRRSSPAPASWRL